MRYRLWPRSLAARTALVLLVGLALVQVAGLAIHALDRLDAATAGAGARPRVRLIGALPNRGLTTPAQQRAAVVHDCEHGAWLRRLARTRRRREAALTPRRAFAAAAPDQHELRCRCRGACDRARSWCWAGRRSGRIMRRACACRTGAWLNVAARRRRRSGPGIRQTSSPRSC